MMIDDKKAERRPLMIAPDGTPMAVIRPDDPALALRLAEECLKSKRTGDDASKAFNAILHAQPYRFVGFCEGTVAEGKEPRILSRDGEVLGDFLPGDSFVPSSALAQPE